MNDKNQTVKEQHTDWNHDWNPDLYLKFKNERTQPSIDLISKINISFRPKSILDIGCGPGNSSQALLQRWPGAKLTGIDSSPNMIDKAKKSYPDNIWIVADASKYTSDTKYDIVFSNATIQWIPNHENLFKNFLNLTNDGGVLAVSVPRFDEMPISKILNKVAGNEKWKTATKGCAETFTRYDYQFYYNLISPDYQTVEMWQTDYIHVLESQPAIIEWISSTGMKPYLDRLQEKEKTQFEDEVLSEIKHYYPVQNNGKVLFPFKRLFTIGYKQTA
jgi:trans-aconitate 2-methyltransferase